MTECCTGYQRELNYRHPDGSYSAFGPRQENGSIWLTAFVVKSFAQASSYIFIDKQLQQESMEFFKQQQNSNGCFSRVSAFIDTNFQLYSGIITWC